MTKWGLLRYALVAALAAAAALGLWPRRTVTVSIPPSAATLDSVSIAAVTAYRDGVAMVFESRPAYERYVDSLRASLRTTVRVPVRVEIPVLQRDTVLVVDCPCVPETPGVEYRTTFQHATAYPPGDTTQARVTLTYSQHDWPLHPSGHWQDFELYIPGVEETGQVMDKPLLGRVLRGGAIFVAGLGLGYLVAR